MARAKTGGRQKGTRNKKDAILEAAIQKAMTPKAAEELTREAIRQEKGGDSTLLIGLLPYAYSKRATKIEGAGEDSEPLKIILKHVSASPDAGNKS